MKSQSIRLALIVVAGIVVLFAARPAMTWIMFLEENQKAKRVEPEKGEIVSMDESQAFIKMPGKGKKGGADADEAKGATDEGKGATDEAKGAAVEESSSDGGDTKDK